MMKTVARVRRGGQALEIDAEQLVPGDVMLMEAGNRVPADGRIWVAATLEIEEAASRARACRSARRPTRSVGMRWRWGTGSAWRI
jgi:hypothetical protein